MACTNFFSKYEAQLDYCIFPQVCQNVGHIVACFSYWRGELTLGGLDG